MGLYGAGLFKQQRFGTAGAKGVNSSVVSLRLTAHVGTRKEKNIKSMMSQTQRDRSAKLYKCGSGYILVNSAMN